MIVNETRIYNETLMTDHTKSMIESLCAIHLHKCIGELHTKGYSRVHPVEFGNLFGKTLTFNTKDLRQSWTIGPMGVKAIFHNEKGKAHSGFVGGPNDSSWDTLSSKEQLAFAQKMFGTSTPIMKISVYRLGEHSYFFYELTQ